MSRFFNPDYKTLSPYVPGEQPQRDQWIKLNTNESPYPPAPGLLALQVKDLNLYPDPEAAELIKALGKSYGVEKEQIILGNGSDELLAFAFMAFQNLQRVFTFPDLTYGFYPVYAKLVGCDSNTIPLRRDWTIHSSDYIEAKGTIVIANPNAPTGIALSLKEIEIILKGNLENLVIIDEAYVDFGGESSISLVDKYDNLLVIQTFSKSRNLAGARVGFAIANKEIIEDLKSIKYSFNPYNLNRWSEAAALISLKDDEYFKECCDKTISLRKETEDKLRDLDFLVLPSLTNFLFVKPEWMSGKDLYLKLREEKILVRHFDKERIKDFLRITIGNKKEMEELIKAIRKIFKEKVEAK